MNFLETGFLKIIDMSITVSYVIAAIMAVRLLLKIMPKVFSYALWSVAAFRLVCPVSFASGFSLFNIATLFTSQNTGNTLTPSDAGSAAGLQLPAPLPSAVAQTTAHQTAGADAMQTMMVAAVCVWCIGILAMLAYSVISYVNVRRTVRRAVRLESNVYECEGIASPFVLGIIKPKIYIPFRMSETEKACILCHERHHIRRLDHVIKPFAFLILSVYWFHPLVWLAYLCMTRDMEMSCDEKAISLIGSKRDYSLSLLSVGTHRRFPVAGSLFFGESAVKTRVKNVLGFKKPKIGLMVLALVLCITAAVACSADKPVGESAAAQETKTPLPEPSVSAAEPSPQDEDITGLYAFEENIYTNPLSSFFAAKGHMPYYALTDDKLQIINQSDGSIEEFAGTAEPVAISKDDFKALFENEIVLEDMIPDISKFKQCIQYAIYKDDFDRELYRLYLMDDEVWLAQINAHMWSIYRLVITDATTIGIIGGADGPTSVYIN